MRASLTCEDWARQYLLLLISGGWLGDGLILLLWFIDINYMRREAHYLPSLNALFMQNESYSRHVLLLQKTRKTEDRGSSRGSSSLKSLTSIQQQMPTLLHQDRATTSKPQSQDEPRQVEANTVLQRISLDRRGVSQRQREKERSGRILQLSNPSADRPNNRKESTYEAMKERIKKYVREGAMANYKYKRSLIEIDRRKKQREDLYRQESYSLREQMRSKMSLIINEGSQGKVGRSRTEGQRGGDIFCQILENERESSIRRMKEEEYANNRKGTSKKVLSISKIKVQRAEMAKIQATPSKLKIKHSPYVSLQSSNTTNQEEKPKKVHFLHQIERLKKRKQSYLQPTQNTTNLKSRSEFLSQLIDSNRISTEQMIKHRPSKKSQFNNFQAISITPLLPIAKSSPDRSNNPTQLSK